jgi:hypothetical protein
MELSLRTTRSSFTPPNIIAPKRPFPSGQEERKLVAGASNQITSSVAAGAEAANSNAPAVINPVIKEEFTESIGPRLPTSSLRHAFRQFYTAALEYFRIAA